MSEFVASRGAPPKLSVVAREAPSGLRKEGAVFFAEMRRTYHIEDPGAFEVLTRAAECVDTISAARAVLAKDGDIIRNQYDIPKVHPAVAVEKAARDGFYTAMRLLGIDMSSASIADDDPPWVR